MAETGHWSCTPLMACNAILSGLSVLQFVNGGVAGGGTGCVKSISRIPHDTDIEQIKLGMHSGLPAILLFYGAGAIKPINSSQLVFGHDMSFRLLCCSSNFESRVKRQSGSAVMDTDAATVPGVEELQDWAARFAVRALRETDGLSKAYITRMNPAQIVEPGLYVGTVDLTAYRELDAYDDAATTTLQELGLVHDPVDYDALWSDSPTDIVPDSTLPAEIAGGAPYDPED